jgi:histidine triad (HIT) family protein
MAGQIPARIAWQDELCIVLHDIAPQGPVHLLVVPRQPIPRLSAASAADSATLGHLLVVAARMAAEHRLDHGFRVVINNGPHGGESVPHLHVHVIGGRPLDWPPG